MAVPNQDPESKHTGNGSTTVFAYGFLLLAAGDLQVYVNGVLQTLGMHYTVSGAGNPSGGAVTFLAPPANGLTVLLLRQVTAARTTDYQYAGDFQARVVNLDFDRLWMAIQDALARFTTAIRFPRGENALNSILPRASLRARKAVIFDALGNVTVSTDNYNEQAQNAAASALEAKAARDQVVAIADNFDDQAQERLDQIEADGNEILQAFTEDGNQRLATFKADGDAALRAVGRFPPQVYTAGLAMTSLLQTVEYDDKTYAPRVGALPFTTSGTFETAKFQLVQGIAGADLAARNGLPMMGLPATAAQSVFDTALPLQDYAALENFEGDAVRIQFIGVMGTTAPDPRNGPARRVSGAVIPDGGTKWVDKLGRSWVRDFSGKTFRPGWWNVRPGVECSAALNACLLAAAGFSVAFDAGSSEYILGGQINMPSSTKLNLGGNKLKQLAGTRLENGLLFVGSGLTKIRIENGTIDVNVAQQFYTAFKSDTGRGIFVYGANNVRIHRVNFVNPYGSMILAAAASRVYITECDIDDSNATGHSAIEFNQCEYSSARNCTGVGKLGLTGYGVYAHGACSNVQATDNSFRYWQVVFSGTDYITAGTSASMNYCRIDRNTLIDPSADTSIHFGLYGSVSDNVIVNSRDVGISIDYSRNLVVCKNVIRTTNAAGIAMPGCLDCTVCDNMISDPGSQFVTPVDNGQRCGIWAPSTHDSEPPYVYPSGNVICNNTISDGLGVHQMYFGISVADDNGNNVNIVKGNYIRGWVSKALDLPRQTNVGSQEAMKYPVLQNGWVYYGDGYGPAGYCKTDDGVVYLKGRVRAGAVGQRLFTLPEGYRPLEHIDLAVISGTGTGRIDIFPDTGDVVITTGTSDGVSLAGVSFLTR